MRRPRLVHAAHAARYLDIEYNSVLYHVGKGWLKAFQMPDVIPELGEKQTMLFDMDVLIAYKKELDARR